MRNIIGEISKHKNIIIGTLLAPIAMFIFSILAIDLFKLGNYLGTFLRNLYSPIIVALDFFSPQISKMLNR